MALYAEPASDAFDALVRTIVLRHASSVNASLIIDRARRAMPGVIAESDRERFAQALQSAARLFLTDEGLKRLARDLAAIAAPTSIEKRTFAIGSEHDLRAARQAARDLCASLGARSLVQQRVSTVVSELARNILSYTPGGRVDLVPLRATPPQIRIVAEDRGAGISDLETILAGKYRSKTGLGRGLAAVKQMMDRFDIRTGPTGTRIEVEAAL